MLASKPLEWHFVFLGGLEAKITVKIKRISHFQSRSFSVEPVRTAVATVL